MGEWARSYKKISYLQLCQESTIFTNALKKMEKESQMASEDLVIELQNHVKTITAPYKYPIKIEFVTDLPKMTSGKRAQAS
jgi:hypothetical protein